MKKIKIYESEIKRAVRRSLMEKLLLENPSTQEIQDRTKAIEDLTTQYSELNKEMEKSQNESTEKITEEEDWIQDMADDIKKDGTEGTFREWCKKQNEDWNGCSESCWEKAMSTDSKSLHMKVAGAKAFCKRLKK